jgi:transposase-like protein
MEKLSNDVLDQFLSSASTPGDVDSLYSQLLQRMINRSLEAELESHLGYERNDKAEGGRRLNSRNGSGVKTVKGTFGELKIETPRDRDGTFEPKLVKKRQVRLGGIEDKIMALYARGMTTRDIESALVDLYGVTVSHTVISQVTDAVEDEVNAWRRRKLDSVYPIVWIDGIVVKVRNDKHVENRAAHVVLAVNMEGQKDVLGIWMAENEGSKFWHSVLVDLKARGVNDMFIVSMDGLPGLPEAVNAVFPAALTQRCIVHMIRASLRYVVSKDKAAVIASMKAIYQSANDELAAEALTDFETAWGTKYKGAVNLWKNNWADIIPFFQFPPEIRRVVYTTNAIESLNMVLRKNTRNRRIFQGDESALKSLYMAVGQASKNWKMIGGWKTALHSFAILFGEDRLRQ